MLNPCVFSSQDLHRWLCLSKLCVRLSDCLSSLNPWPRNMLKFWICQCTWVVVSMAGVRSDSSGWLPGRCLDITVRWSPKPAFVLVYVFCKLQSSPQAAFKVCVCISLPWYLMARDSIPGLCSPNSQGLLLLGILVFKCNVAWGMIDVATLGQLPNS